jgi:hypothetical protein
VIYDFLAGRGLGAVCTGDSDFLLANEAILAVFVGLKEATHEQAEDDGDRPSRILPVTVFAARPAANLGWGDIGSREAL